MLLEELLDLEKLERDAAEGWIDSKRHWFQPYTIYCYARRTQLEWAWTHERRMCRGVIVDDSGTIVARPFPKFGTYEQHLTWSGGSLPQGHFQAFEKLDGSMLTLYPSPRPLEHMADYAFATKGSFGSEQAIEATKWLDRQSAVYGDLSALFDTSKYTYVFEWISPDNRIVVDYAGWQDAVLLDVLDIETGAAVHSEFQRIEAAGWPCVQPATVEYTDVGDLASMYQQVADDAEGYVLRYDNGTRIKIKGERYLELHKLKEHLSPKRVLEAYVDKGDEWLQGLPPEFLGDVLPVVVEYKQALADILEAATGDYAYVKPWLERKQQASFLKTRPTSGVTFCMLDSKWIRAADLASRLAVDEVLRCT